MSKAIITATCACCGKTEDYQMDEKETETYFQYMRKDLSGARQMGCMQDLFPKVPAWIRAGAIDKCSDGFCICPECGPF